jgi:hypothetical protein
VNTVWVLMAQDLRRRLDTDQEIWAERVYQTEAAANHQCCANNECDKTVMYWVEETDFE